LLCMLHPCLTQSIHMGIIAASPSLLSAQLTIPARPEPRQRGQIRVSRPDPIRVAIQVQRVNPSQPA
jgi:hypothetical protein